MTVVQAICYLHKTCINQTYRYADLLNGYMAYASMSAKIGYAARVSLGLRVANSHLWSSYGKVK
jgi:hypothetical protein